MRFIFSVLAALALGLGVLTACQRDGAASTALDASKPANSPAAPAAPAPANAPKTDDGHGHGQQDKAPRISLADAKRDFDEGKAIFIDTRAADAYNLEHIKGAINITNNDVETRYKEIPAGKKIIVYCS